MLPLGLLPVAAFADRPVTARITGGVFQDFAPSPHHFRHVLMPLLARMGLHSGLTVERPGYVPRGAGVIELRVEPLSQPLAPLTLEEPGRPGPVAGIASASHLGARRVAERMAATCEEDLAVAGFETTIDRIEDETADQAGARLAVWTESPSGCLFGADWAGALRRRAESIGHDVARALLADLGSGATTDRHVANQLVPFAAVAAGATRWLVPAAT